MNEIINKINDDINLIQYRDGLTFGTDALLLAAFIRKMPKKNAVEFGSGTGIISILCANRNKFKRIQAVEIQTEYFELIERNLRLNNITNVVPVNDDIKNLNVETDVIFTNPPYMKVDHGKKNDVEKKYIARHEVHGDINDFCYFADKSLKYGGLFYVVYRPDRMIDLLCAMRSNNIEPKRMVTVYQDKYHEPCLILVEGRKGGKPSIFTPRPLLLYDEGEMTEDLKYIYDNGEFNERFIKK